MADQPPTPGDAVAPAAPAALQLVVPYATDIEAARRFYTCLGLHFDDERHGQGPAHYAAQAGSVVFEIYPANAAASQGKLRIGFAVAALDAVLDALQEQPAKVITPPRDSPWGRRAVVEDPDGNRVELSQRLGGPAL